MNKSKDNSSKLDQIVADARKNRETREQGYRDKALKTYPWICGRCSREFNRSNVQELTVHHRNHDHDYNPEDGSNWELLCVYCHDNEHQRLLEAVDGTQVGSDGKQKQSATYNPFADLKNQLKKS